MGALRKFGGEGTMLSPSPTAPLTAAEGEALPPTLGNSGVQSTHRPGELVFWDWDVCTPSTLQGSE